jgi:hypothetical protein
MTGTHAHVTHTHTHTCINIYTCKYMHGCGGAHSAATHGFIYVYVSHAKVWRATSGRWTPRRAADGRTHRRAADRRALCYGWAPNMLTPWGKGGHGGSSNVEAGNMYQQSNSRTVAYRARQPLHNIFPRPIIGNLRVGNPLGIINNIP